MGRKPRLEISEEVKRKVFELHQVSPYEIDEAIKNDIGFRIENPEEKKNPSYFLFSETDEGRVLALGFEIKGDQHGLITAFDPDYDDWKDWRRKYEQAKNE